MTRLPCAREDWPEFSHLLFDALDLPVAERPAWLAGLPERYARLREALAQVLRDADRAGAEEFMLSPPSLPAPRSDFRPGMAIGPYELMLELGRGGMGEVWLARRNDGTMTRAVALKLPHPHLLTATLRQRFERERDILSGLSHAHIAQLYDAGISEAGHPYLAMERVDGQPITRYCREAALPLRERLALFRQVLDAVHHAHSRFIAHRDLKPSNILVTREGQVKLLDFGIAKLLDPETGGAATELTQLGGRAATPDYAAPEQIDGGTITTAVDIYALGIILFELLAGTRPFESRKGTRTRPIEAPLASQQFPSAHAAAVGGIGANRLRKALRGDLDAILAKALEADPARRYRSAEAFAEDIDRSLRHEPIAARHMGAVSRAARLIRRHRLASALVAGLAFTFVGGSIAVSWEALRAQQAATHAEAEALRAESEAKRQRATRDFLVGVFKASDPRIASDRPRGTITARELLDTSTDRIERDFAGDPDTEAELLSVSSEIYGEFDDHARALALLRKSVALAEARHGDSDPAVIDGLLREASFAIDDGNDQQASELLSRTDSLIRLSGRDRSALRANWLYLKSSSLIASPGADAKRQRLDALQNSVALFAAVAPDDRTYPSALADLSNEYFSQPDYPRATEYNRRAVNALESQHSGDEGDLAQLYGALAFSLLYNGDFDAASHAYDHALDLARRSYGENQRFYWVAAARYAQTIDMQGDYRRASDLIAPLLRSLPDRAHGFRNADDEHEAAVVNETWGNCLSADGRPAEAIAYLKTAEQEYVEAPQYAYELAHLRSVLALAYQRSGQHEEADRLYRSALDQYLAQFKPDNPAVLKLRQGWGDALFSLNRLDDARDQYEQVLRGAPASRMYFTALAHGGLANIANRRGDTGTALRESRQAIDLFRTVEGIRDVRTGPQLWHIHAQALLQSGDATAALDWAQRADDADRQYDAPGSADLAEAEATLKSVKQAVAAGVRAGPGLGTH